MTNREKIINYLKDGCGMDLWWLQYEETDKWKRPGTIVLDSLSHWNELKHFADRDNLIEIHQIRERFEWKYALRIIWIGGKA